MTLRGGIVQRGTRELNEPERRAGRLWGSQRHDGAATDGMRGARRAPPVQGALFGEV